MGRGKCRGQLQSNIKAGLSLCDPPLLLSVRFAHCPSIPCLFPAGDTRNIGVGVGWAVNGRRRFEVRRQETLDKLDPLNRKMFSSGVRVSVTQALGLHFLLFIYLSIGWPASAVGLNTTGTKLGGGNRTTSEQVGMTAGTTSGGVVETNTRPGLIRV